MSTILEKNEIIPQGIIHAAPPSIAPPPVSSYHSLPIGKVVPSTFNPRKYFDEQALRELANSIDDHGVLEPILVRPKKDAPGLYEIVAGERRWRAAKIADEEAIPCIVRDLSDDLAVEIAVVENLQRKDLDPFEEARGYTLMLALPGMNQTRVAERLNCSQARVAKIVGLLKLPQAVQDMIQSGELSPSHGQRLLPYSEFAQVCTSLALIAKKEQWPASKLDGLTIPQNTLHYLNAIKPAPVVEMGYQTKFDWKEVCVKNCPFKAFRPGEYESRAVCLKPEHYQALQAEAAVTKQAEQDALNRQAIAAYAARRPTTPLPVIATVPAEKPLLHWDDWDNAVARAAQALANAAMQIMATKAAPLPELPSVREMANDSYQTIHNPPPGCSEACACRALAKGWYSDVIEICMNPSRFNKMVADRRKEETQAKRVECEARLAEAFRVLDAQFPIQPALFATDNEPYPVRQIASLALYRSLFDMGIEHIKPALARRGITLDPDLFKHDYREKRQEARLIAELAQYSSSTLLALAAEVQLRREAKNAQEYESGNVGLADFLTGQTTKEQTR